MRHALETLVIVLAIATVLATLNFIGGSDTKGNIERILDNSPKVLKVDADKYIVTHNTKGVLK